MKKILAFEADLGLARQLAQQLAPYGCTVDVVDDGNVGLQKARNNRPDLILLTIELPKMNGFSICNKLKKNPDLKGIPLIILSSEATEDTFQQHRKLRTHAEDYLRKPFDFQELLQKIGALVELGGGPVEAPPVPGEAEISIDTSGLDLMVEEEAEPEGPFSGVEEDVEAFAESAFAALQLDGAEGEGAPPTEAAPAGFEDFDNDERTIAGESPFQMAELRAAAAAQAPQAPLPRVAPEVEVEELEAEELEAEELEAEELEEAFEEEPAPQVAAPTPPPAPPVAEAAPPAVPSQPAGPSEEEDRLRAEVESLLQEKAAAEREAEKLRAQAAKDEEARAALEAEAGDLRARTEKAEEVAHKASEEAQALKHDKSMLEKQVSQLKEQVVKAGEGGGVSSREFLDLRELLNKKDRELLDLKDAINAKEKALLDQREKLTAHAREIADRDDKTLALERQLEDLNDKLAATTADKELLGRKVEGLDKRVESGQAEIERLRKELEKEQDAHKESKKAGEERRRKELDELKARLEKEANLARDAALSGLRDELEGRLAAETAALRTEAEEAAAAAEERREGELAEQRLRHEEALRATEERLLAEKEGAVAEQAEAHQKATEGAGKAHAEELARLREEHAAALAKVKEERDQQLDETRRVHQRDMGVLGMKLAETETRLKGAQDTGEELRARVSELEGAVAERDERLSALEGERDRLRRDLETARDTIGARDAEVQTLKERAALLESRNGHNEERALRALRKVQGDQETLERARRAMAIALTILADMPAHEDIGPPPGSKDGTLRT